MSRDDAAYFERRAETQIELASKSDDPRAVQAHYALANFYLERIYGAANEAEAANDD